MPDYDVPPPPAPVPKVNQPIPVPPPTPRRKKPAPVQAPRSSSTLAAITARLGGETVFTIFHVLGLVVGMFVVKIFRNNKKPPPVVLLVSSALVFDVIAYTIVLYTGTDHGRMTTALMAGAIVAAIALVLIDWATSGDSTYWTSEGPKQSASATALMSNALTSMGFVVAIWLAFKV
jgi:hypothetical protein